MLPTFANPHYTVVLDRTPGGTVEVTVLDMTCDVQQVDETGYVWTFLDEARDPSVITTGAIIVAGDDDEPVSAWVVDVVGSGADRKVHLDVLPAAPERYLEAADRARLAAH